MDDHVIWMLLLQVVLIGLNAVFACAEIAVISVNENKVEKLAEKGNRKAKKLLGLVEDPARFLATIQVAITLSGFLGSAFAADNFSGYFVDWLVGLGVSISPEILDTIAVIVITIILSYFTLVFGELVPKQIAMRKKEQLALSVASLITVISLVFKPLVSLLTISTNGVLRLFGMDPNDEGDDVSEEEIRLMVEAGSEKGTIDLEENEWIQNVFEFDDLPIKDVMTHRKDVRMLDWSDPIEVWNEQIMKSSHSLLPLYQENKDHIVGVLNVKRYFRLKDRSNKEDVKKAILEPYFVPENLKADVLFRHMKKEKKKLAIVLDEYGGVCGVVTMNDLIEELIGDLNDDEQTQWIEPAGKNRWKLIGNVSLDEIEEMTGVIMEDGEEETLNGLIYKVLDRVPDDGERFGFEKDGLGFEIVLIKDHQVHYAIVKKLDQD